MNKNTVTVWDNEALTAGRYTVKIQVNPADEATFFSMSGDCISPFSLSLEEKENIENRKSGHNEHLSEAPELSKDDKPLDRKDWPEDLRIGISQRIKEVKSNQRHERLEKLTGWECQLGDFKLETYYYSKYFNPEDRTGRSSGTGTWVYGVSFDGTYCRREDSGGIGVGNTEAEVKQKGLDYVRGVLEKSQKALSALNNVPAINELGKPYDSSPEPMVAAFTKADSKSQEFVLALMIYLAKQMDWRDYARFLSEQMDQGLWIPPGELEMTVAERLGPVEQRPMVHPHQIN